MFGHRGGQSQPGYGRGRGVGYPAFQRGGQAQNMDMRGGTRGGMGWGGQLPQPGRGGFSAQLGQGLNNRGGFGGPLPQRGGGNGLLIQQQRGGLSLGTQQRNGMAPPAQRPPQGLAGFDVSSAHASFGRGYSQMYNQSGIAGPSANAPFGRGYSQMYNQSGIAGPSATGPYGQGYNQMYSQSGVARPSANAPFGRGYGQLYSRGRGGRGS